MKKIFFLLTIFFTLVDNYTYAQDAEAKLKELNIVLPVIGKPIANYVHLVREIGRAHV